MQEDLDIDPIRWGWVTAMFALAYCIFEIPTGAMGDRIGPRRVLTRVVLWWSAFTALTGAMSNYSLLLLTRFCFGAGEAGAFPNASIVVSRWFPPPQRASMAGVLLMASQIGGAWRRCWSCPSRSATDGAPRSSYSAASAWSGRRLVRVVPRFARGETGVGRASSRKLRGARRRRRTAFPGGWRSQSETRAGHAGHGVLLCLRVHVLPDVVSHVPGQRAWIQRKRPDPVGAALRPRRVREPGGRSGRAMRSCSGWERKGRGRSLGVAGLVSAGIFTVAAMVTRAELLTLVLLGAGLRSDHLPAGGSRWRVPGHRSQVRGSNGGADEHVGATGRPGLLRSPTATSSTGSEATTRRSFRWRGLSSER